MRKALITVAIALAASLGAAHVARADTSPSRSTNWSGYSIGTTDPAVPESFTDVTASWVQPKATCTAGQNDAAAFWVGLGGVDETSTSLEQLGTEVDCNGSGTVATSDAWWEIVPAASVHIPLKIFAGDHITAALVVNGETVTMSLRDVTRKTRFSKVVTETQPLDTSSAEWIAEAPSECSSSTRCRVLSLSQFGTVTFSNAAAIGNGVPGTINATTWAADPIDLVPESGAHGIIDRGVPTSSLGAAPTALSADGRSFSVSPALASSLLGP